MCNETDLVLVGDFPTGPGPAESSGLVAVATLDENGVKTQHWQLTAEALLICRDLEKRLDRMVHRVARAPDQQRRYSSALALLSTVGLQTDHDGILIALDYTSEALRDPLQSDPVFERAMALGEELEPAFTFDDPHGELAFPRLAFALARLEDPNLMERCLGAAVTRLREGRFDLDEMASLIEAMRQ